MPSPNLRAAITKQLASIQPHPDDPGADRVYLDVEVTTVTTKPYQLQATSLDTPDGLQVESIGGSVCTPTTNDVDFRCRHPARLYATTACSGTGNYELMLQYQCDPVEAACGLCNSETTVPFSLTTEGGWCSEGPILEGENP